MLFFILNILLSSLCANCFFLIRKAPLWTLAFLCVFVFVNFLPALPRREIPNFRLKVCHHGIACLKLFCFSCGISVIFHIGCAAFFLPGAWIISIIICVCANAVLFWNGMISVYAASVQLGIRHRALGILCGFIPVVHLILLLKIIRVVSDEVAFETEKAKCNSIRKPEQICRTKYPVLLVHGVFFRDSRFLNYWGRISEELTRNGAQIFYGNHQSAASVSDAAAELTARIKKITEETGCEKVNIIAHSKGGLDCRYAISCFDAAPYVASLTTVNTPHHGCEFADYLLNRVPQKIQQKIASAYNAAMRKMGDKTPDFMAAVQDLTAKRCAEQNRLMKDTDMTGDIYCQSIGSKLNHATGGKFPLNFTYWFVKRFDGPNDGLVSEDSFRWGENYRFLTTNGRRGISHGDMIDLNRENIPGFDVREFYVDLLSDLKARGL